MTGAKIGVAASMMATMGVAWTEDWAAIEKLGLVGLCLIAVAVLYRSGEKMRLQHEAAQEKREDMLREVIATMTAATQRSSDAIVASTEALRNVEIIVRHCQDRGNGGSKP